ncbi:MAG: hypothetical protein HQL79_11545 [Magnetococcales bacterium]|nr:hypothetical protein [Magnetococcales bacterium]MBF0416387.1 hypothetical protein [Magnetococcales bacterium]
MASGATINSKSISRRRDAIRLLFILVAGKEPLSINDESGANHIFKGETRLHALDFWVRYPDYLADELLDKYERNQDASLIQEVRRILTEEEPDLRRLPMMRWLRGAYDPVDTAISYLSARKLVQPRKRQSDEKVREYEFLIFPKAIFLAEHIVKEFPLLSWYDHRSRLVVSLAAGRGGNALKQQQHSRAEYHATLMGNPIPPIKDKVWARFRKLTEVAA